MSVDDLRKAFQPRRVECRVLVDGSLLDRHAALEAELQRAIREDVELNRIAVAPALTEQIRALEDEIEAKQATFVMSNVGRGRWLDLLSRHQPSREDAAQGLDFDPRTFPPAAVALSCVEPELTLEDAEWLFDALDLAEWSRIWNACLEANLGREARPKSLVAIAAARTNGKSSTIAVAAE